MLNPCWKTSDLLWNLRWECLFFILNKLHHFTNDSSKDLHLQMSFWLYLSLSFFFFFGWVWFAVLIFSWFTLHPTVPISKIWSPLSKTRFFFFFFKTVLRLQFVPSPTRVWFSSKASANTPLLVISYLSLN